MITLATLHLATAQEVYDQVVDHLRQQGVRCMNEDGECQYRISRGLEMALKCAAGCFISDEEYDQKRFEGNGWVSLVNKGIVVADHRSLIMRLQVVHDHKVVNSWEREFEEVAGDYGLVYTTSKK